MARFDFPVVLTPAAEWAPGDTGFVVTFPDLPEAITQGEDRADALRKAADCLEEALAGRIRRGDDIPVPSAATPIVAPGAVIAAKAALHLALREAGLTKVALAARLGWDEKEVRRLLDPRQPSKIQRIDAALAALGRRLVIDLSDAA